jgi:hypothetical protein
MRQIGFACAAFALGIFATPLMAQQTTPDQPPTEQKGLPTSVPPAPPPDRQPESPPPFPPMSSRAPHHRFVDMGRHSTSRHHATKSARASNAAAHHKGSHNRRETTHAHRKGTDERHAAAPLSKKAQRRCLKLSVSQALRNSSCKAMIQDQLETKNEHHRAAHRHGKDHHKAAAANRKQSRHSTTKHSRKTRHKASD